MSQRALKKRELLNLHTKQQQEKETAHQIYRKQSQQQLQQPLNAQKFKFFQRNNNLLNKNTNNTCETIKHLANVNKNSTTTTTTTNLATSRRIFHSTPNLSEIQSIKSDYNQTLQKSSIVRSHSDTDITSIPETNRLVNAKSEFHLKSIASTRVAVAQDQLVVDNRRPSLRNTTSTQIRIGSGARSETRSIGNQSKVTMQSKRSSIHSGLSSNTVCSITSSASDSTQPPTTGFADVENIRIPIIGYEVMEERARFTVYKLRVENPFTNDCWLVLRRYTDFQRLNQKLRTTFPQMPPLTLPRKKLFGDNFSSLFLSNRVQGLQMFINAVMANEMLRNSQIVRDFFCLDEPPAYSESMEECRAIFEAQEETIAHLKMQLRAKTDIIMSLQQQLNDETEHNKVLSAAIDLTYEKCSNCSKTLDEFLKKKTQNKQ